jgi:RNA polymerase sigma-70 factor, ECF subfamily
MHTPPPLSQPAPSEQDVSNQVLRLLLSRRRELLAYIRAIVRDYDMAEDVYQEVCVAVLRRQNDIVVGEQVEGYFRKVARHAALAALEKKGRTPSALSGEVLETLDQAWSRPASGDSVKSETLQRCVQKLPPRSRELLHYRYDKRLTGKNLAEKIGSTPESAYVALSRIHRALRECVTRSGVAIDGHSGESGDPALGGGI